MAAWRHGGLNSLTVVEERPATGQAALVHRALPGRIRARRRPAARHEEARLRPHRQQQRRRGQRRRRRAGRVRGSASAPREGRRTGAHAQTQRVLRVHHAGAAQVGRNRRAVHVRQVTFGTAESRNARATSEPTAEQSRPPARTAAVPQPPMGADGAAAGDHDGPVPDATAGSGVLTETHVRWSRIAMSVILN